VSWVERGGNGRVFELRRSAGKKSLLSSAVSHVEKGSQVDTDTWGGYQLLSGVYRHRSVKHSEGYVSDEGAHCSTAEGEWSVFKPWWRRFRGIVKRYLHQCLSHHSFRRTHRVESRIERTRAMIGFLILGVFWRENACRQERPRASRCRTAQAMCAILPESVSALVGIPLRTCKPRCPLTQFGPSVWPMVLSAFQSDAISGRCDFGEMQRCW
jgi:hypothetical protein